MMPSQLHGVLTALATPFASDGRVDTGVLRRLVDHSIDGGVHGVVACGSTGEFAAQSGAWSSRPSSTRPPAACPWSPRPAR
jgi:4-hydroxy-tetrahydrodipicolinate synthase